VAVQEASPNEAATTDIDITVDVTCHSSNSAVYLQPIDELDDALLAIQLVDNTQDIKTHQ
jgi:hypothetical protein